jgi:hypothetical protein
MRRARLAGLVAATVLAASCGGASPTDDPVARPSLQATAVPEPDEAVTNGIDEVSPDEALSQAREALLVADSFRVAGSPTAGAPLDLVLVAGERGEADDGSVGRGSVGKVSQSGSTFEMLAVDGAVHVRGNLTWLADAIGEDAQRTLGDKWLLLPESLAESLATFADPQAFVQAVLVPVGPVQSVGVSVIDGVPAVGVQFVDSEATAWISGTGEPYPLLVERRGATATDGVLRFSDIGAQVTISAPPAADIVVAPEPSQE